MHDIKAGEKMKEVIWNIISTHTHAPTYNFFISKANIIMLKRKQIGKTICDIYDKKIIFLIY